MTGPIQTELKHYDSRYVEVWRTLSERDSNPVWKAFVHFICYRHPSDASAVSQWSDRTIAAVTDALASVEQMRALGDAYSKSMETVAASFADLEDEFLDYLVAGPQSETILMISYGRRPREIHASYIKRFNDMYFVGSTDEMGMAGPYLFLDECLSYFRKFMLDRARNKLINVTFSAPVAPSFIDHVIISSCPLIGTLFNVNGRLCVRSDETAFVELIS